MTDSYVFTVIGIWHEIRVPAGYNIIRAAGQMAEMSNSTGLRLMADLNGIDCRIEPGANPHDEEQKIAESLAKRSPA